MSMEDIKSAIDMDIARDYLRVSFAIDIARNAVEEYEELQAENERLKKAQDYNKEHYIFVERPEYPCERCGGRGRRAYGNTATWSGGIGGNMITGDVCDRCWGTGDANRKGANLRVLFAQLKTTKGGE